MKLAPKRKAELIRECIQDSISTQINYISHLKDTMKIFKSKKMRSEIEKIEISIDSVKKRLAEIKALEKSLTK